NTSIRRKVRCRAEARRKICRRGMDRFEVWPERPEQNQSLVGAQQFLRAYRNSERQRPFLPETVGQGVALQGARNHALHRRSNRCPYGDGRYRAEFVPVWPATQQRPNSPVAPRFADLAGRNGDIAMTTSCVAPNPAR